MSPRRIRIAFLASTLPTGGAERVTFELFSRMDRERFDVQLYFLKAPGTIGEKLIEAGLPATANVQKRRVDPMVAPRMLRALRGYKPDIMFVLNCHRNAMFWGGLTALLARTPIHLIATHQTGTMRGARNYDGIDRLFLGSATSILALSKRHAAYVRDVDGVDEKKITVIENGIDVDAYDDVDADAVRASRAALGLSPDDRVVIMVAGMRPEKAHGALVAAAQRLVPVRPGLKFLLVGDGPMRPELEGRARDLGLEHNILFLGERSDVALLLHASDVFVLPSRPAVETLPLSVMEAMAAGVPVVASAVGSVPDMITDGVNGHLIAPADDAELARAIERLLADGAHAKRIAENARRTVREKYSVERMVQKYESHFESLVASRGGGTTR